MECDAISDYLFIEVLSNNNLKLQSAGNHVVDSCLQQFFRGSCNLVLIQVDFFRFAIVTFLSARREGFYREPKMQICTSRYWQTQRLKVQLMLCVTVIIMGLINSFLFGQDSLLLLCF